MKTYTVKSPINHGTVVDGKATEQRYEPGDDIDLDDSAAAPLLAVQAIVDPNDGDGDGQPDKPAKSSKKSK